MISLVEHRVSGRFRDQWIALASQVLGSAYNGVRHFFCDFLSALLSWQAVCVRLRWTFRAVGTGSRILPPICPDVAYRRTDGFDLVVAGNTTPAGRGFEDL